MTGWSNGQSFAVSNADVPRRVPPWKFGVGPASMSDDRGGL
jgi:hypothetical protein